MYGRPARRGLHASVTAPRVASPAMATLPPHALPPASREDARIRRWCVLAIAAALLLAAYAGGIAWVTHQLEAGVDRSIQPLPTVIRDRPDA